MEQIRMPDCIQRRYRYLRDLGEGGMGRVVLVQDLEEGGPPLALKWVPMANPISPDQLRHRREFQILSRFSHPHLLRAYRFGQVEGVGQYFTCEYLAGQDLSEAADQLDDTHNLEIWIQLLRGLAYMHRQGWVHGDVKPENLILRRPVGDGPIDVCLVDFGLAYPEGRPAEERILGTVYYMPPERILGSRMDRRGDLYSAGVLGYKLLTGRLPFPGPGKAEVLDGHLQHLPPRPKEINTAIPDVVDALLMDLLAKKPEERPESAEQVLQRLRLGYGKPTTLETPETLRAHVRNLDPSGWENPLETIYRLVRHRLGRSVLDDDGETKNIVFKRPDPDDEERDQPGFVVTRNHSAIDMARFRQILLNRLEMTGHALIQVDAGARSAPVAELVRQILARLPDSDLRDDELFQALMRVSNSSPESLIPQLVNWLAAVAKRFPFAVLVHGFEEWNSPIFDLVSAVAEREPELPQLGKVAWVGFQRQTCHKIPFHAPNAAPPNWVKSVPLHPLDPDGMNRWLQARFPGWQLPKELFYLLQEESEGSPGLLQKILSSLLEEGLLYRDWQDWRVVSFTDEHTQTPIVRWAMQSYGSLKVDLRSVLDGLVVLGGSGDPEWIRRVAIASQEGFDDKLRELTRRGWIEQESDGNRLRFRYFFQCKAARLAIPEEIWRGGNQRVAKWLLDLEAEGAEIDPERLAGHLMNCGKVRKAVFYARRAVRHALAQGRILNAIRWLEQILATDDTLAPRHQVALIDELGDLRRMWGPAEEILALRQRAVDVEETSAGKTPLWAKLSIKLGECRGLAGDSSESIRILHAVLQQLDIKEEPELCRQCLIHLIEILLSQDRATEVEGLWAMLEAIPEGSKSKLLGDEATIRIRFALYQGNTELALHICEHAIAQLDSREGRIAGAWAVFLLAQRFELKRDWAQAIHNYRVAAQQFSRCRNTLQQARCLMHMGELFFTQEVLFAADDALQRADALFLRIGAEIDRPRLAKTQGLLLARRGWHREAWEKFAIMEEWGASHPETRWSWEGDMARAEDAIRRGELAQARELLLWQAHPNRLRDGREVQAWSRWGVLWQRCMRKSGDHRSAERGFQEALRSVRASGLLGLELPLWIERWKFLKAVGAESEAENVAERMSLALRDCPEHSFRWAVTRETASEKELIHQDDAEVLAGYYFREGVRAFRSSQWGHAAFLFEEAQHHARRVRTQPLDALISTYLALVRPKVVPTDIDSDEIVERAWNRLVELGVQEGRLELLGLWAAYRQQRNGRAGSLTNTARRHFDDWVDGLPFPIDREKLLAHFGLDELFAQAEASRQERESLRQKPESPIPG